MVCLSPVGYGLVVFFYELLPMTHSNYTKDSAIAKHHIPQATNIPYQPLLTKLIFSVLVHAEKNSLFSKLVFQYLLAANLVVKKPIA